MLSSISFPLSHLVDEKHSLSHDSVLRLKKASSIFYKDNCDLLFTSGCAYKESMKKTLSLISLEFANSKFMIPKDQIIQLPLVKDTVGEAVFSRFEFERIGIPKNLNIITSDWHLNRVKEVFNYIYGDTIFNKINFYVIPGDTKALNDEIKNDSILEFRKLVSNCDKGDFKSIYKQMMTNHPQYNNG